MAAKAMVAVRTVVAVETANVVMAVARVAAVGAREADVQVAVEMATAGVLELMEGELMANQVAMVTLTGLGHSWCVFLAQ